MTRKTALLFCCKHAAAAACVLLILSLLSCNSCRHNETGGVSPGEGQTSGGWMDAPKLTNAAKVYDVTYTPAGCQRERRDYCKVHGMELLRR